MNNINHDNTFIPVYSFVVFVADRDVNALSGLCDKVEGAAHSTVEFAHSHMDELGTAARDFAFSLARTYIGKLWF